MQIVADGIPDLLISQNRTKAVRLLFCLQIILIDNKFALFSVGQGVYIEGKEISERGFMYCQLVCWYIILY